ncbi:transposase [Aerococcaceae bacterium DSM 111020]|nr:transposase [Aerococcaceae bacterium DSM 111020]
MVTLQENAVKFNSNLIVSHDGGRLSSDSGLILIDELMDAFQFTQLSKKIVRFNDSRKYWTHTNHKLLKQLVLQIFCSMIRYYRRYQREFYTVLKKIQRIRQHI